MINYLLKNFIFNKTVILLAAWKYELYGYDNVNNTETNYVMKYTTSDLISKQVLERYNNTDTNNMTKTIYNFNSYKTKHFVYNIDELNYTSLYNNLIDIYNH